MFSDFMIWFDQWMLNSLWLLDADKQHSIRLQTTLNEPEYKMNGFRMKLPGKTYNNFISFQIRLFHVNINDNIVQKTYNNLY